MGKNVQLPARLTLFRTLVDRGILFAVQWALNLHEREEANRNLISMAGEVLSAMLDHDLNGVRGHVMKQDFAILREREAGKKGADKAETILEMACRIMAQSKDMSVQSQMGDALKSWLEIPIGEPPANPGGTEVRATVTIMFLAVGYIIEQAVGPKPLLARKDDPNTERFMDYFYRNCVDILLKPLTNLPEWKNFKDSIYTLTREETNRYVYLCDLLYNFIQQHQLRAHVHVTTSDILSRIATLFRAKDKHIRHGEQPLLCQLYGYLDFTFCCSCLPHFSPTSQTE
jgi:protein phosphatase-4 regulatory subunit 3